MEMSRLVTKPTMWLCAQRRRRSAWASAQSDQSSLSAWRNLGSLATNWVHSEDSDQTGRMPRLIWVFAGCTLTLLVLSRGGSNYDCTCVFCGSLTVQHLRPLSCWYSSYTDIKGAWSCENVSYAICEQQKSRSACASAQSDQHLCCSLLR